MSAPDLREASRFLHLLCGSADPIVTFQTFDDAKPARLGKARIFHGRLSEYSSELAELNAAGAGVFVMVNRGDGKLHEGKNSVRTALNVIGTRAAFVDLDGAPIEPVLSAEVRPTIVVESSPGRYHAYWLLTDLSIDQFTPLQVALALRFNADPNVKDLPRVMRVPGFWHLKDKPFMSRIIQPVSRSEKQPHVA